MGLYQSSAPLLHGVVVPIEVIGTRIRAFPGLIEVRSCQPDPDDGRDDRHGLTPPVDRDHFLRQMHLPRNFLFFTGSQVNHIVLLVRREKVPVDGENSVATPSTTHTATKVVPVILLASWNIDEAFERPKY